MGAFSANSTEIRNTAELVSAKEKAFENSLEQIEAQINHLGDLWNSPTYDQFKQLFNQKLPNLKEGDALMIEFRTKLEKAAESFDDAQRNIINSFN